MSWTMIQRAVIASSLTLGALGTGCGSNGGSDNVDGGDAGGGEGGAGDGGGADAASDAGDAGGDAGTDAGKDPCMGKPDCITTIDCNKGTSDKVTCDGYEVAGSIWVQPCCFTKGATDVCGFRPADLGTGSFGKDECLEVHAPGKQSMAASTFFDQTAADDKAELEDYQVQQGVCEVPIAVPDGGCPANTLCDNGLFDLRTEVVPGQPINLTYNGCCTEDGQFGVDLSSPTMLMLPTPFGCVGFETLQASLQDSSANMDPCKAEKDTIDGENRNGNTLPFCDPATGKPGCPPVLNATLCGLLTADPPAGAGLPYTCTPGDATPAWVCNTTGLDPMAVSNAGAGYCMEGLPSSLAGCGATAATSDAGVCIPYVPMDVVGCAP